MGRPKGVTTLAPRRRGWKHLAAPRSGSESSRILRHRLGVAAAGGGMTKAEEDTLTPHNLNEFEQEQIVRVKRILARSESRIRAARDQVQRENERATRHEAITSFEVEVRGSCGSDAHMRES